MTIVYIGLAGGFVIGLLVAMNRRKRGAKRHADAALAGVLDDTGDADGGGGGGDGGGGD